MRLTTLLCLGIFVLWVLAFLAQTWFSPFSPDTFWKLSVSLFLVGLVPLVIHYINKDREDTERLRGGGGLD